MWLVRVVPANSLSVQFCQTHAIYTIGDAIEHDDQDILHFNEQRADYRHCQISISGVMDEQFININLP
jgi:hypothetical protein